MVTTSAVLGIAAVALGLVLTPGPNMIYLVSRSITQGRTAGFVSLLGVAAGFLVYLAAAAAGLATVFVAVPAAYTVLKLVGGGCPEFRGTSVAARSVRRRSRGHLARGVRQFREPRARRRRVVPAGAGGR
jgi:threonine/homoserine/homoserine lactone efflux protein